MFLIWGRRTGASAIGAVSFGNVAEGCQGIESSSHNHGSVSVGPVNYCVVLFRFWGVESDCESGVVIGSWW